MYSKEKLEYEKRNPYPKSKYPKKVIFDKTIKYEPHRMYKILIFVVWCNKRLARQQETGGVR